MTKLIFLIMIEKLKLELPWKNNHIHKNININNLGIQYNIEYSISVIKNSIKK